MYNSIRTFSYLFGYLPIAAVHLKRFQARKNEMDLTEYDSLIYSQPQKWAKGIMKRTKSTINISGLDNLPEGPVLFVSNHEGNFDIPVLLSTIPKPFGFISKKEVNKFPVLPTYMEEMNCVFIDRSDRRSALKSIGDTVEKLKQGHSILIFPEGTRNKGGELGEFKAGFIRIAKDSSVPIVPIAISGTSEIMEKNNNKVKPGNVSVQVLKPIPPGFILQEDAKTMGTNIRAIIEQALANPDI